MALLWQRQPGPASGSHGVCLSTQSVVWEEAHVGTCDGTGYRIPQNGIYYWHGVNNLFLIVLNC